MTLNDRKLNKLIIGIILILFLTILLLFSSSIYLKKTNEKEQLVISEVQNYISSSENREVLIPELEIEKPSLFSSYEEWYVTSSINKKKYRYSDGLVSQVKK